MAASDIDIERELKALPLETTVLLNKADSGRVVSRWLLGLLITLVLVMFLPWQQNVQGNGAGAPILFLRSAAVGESFPRGELDATIDGQSLVVHVRKIAINKVVARGTKTNLLPDILRRWFGPDAGKPGTGFKVWLRRRGDRVTMEPMSLARAAEPEV